MLVYLALQFCVASALYVINTDSAQISRVQSLSMLAFQLAHQLSFTFCSFLLSVCLLTHVD